MRKIEYNVAYHTLTREAYHNFMETAEKQGLKWANDKKPTQYDVFDRYKKQTAISLTKWGLLYGTAEYFSDKGEKVIKWNISDKHPVIVEHIIRGKKTIVKLSNGKVGTARCHPDDEFDIYEGLRIATARAFGKTECRLCGVVVFYDEAEIQKWSIAAQKAASDWSRKIRGQ